MQPNAYYWQPGPPSPVVQPAPKKMVWTALITGILIVLSLFICGGIASMAMQSNATATTTNTSVQQQATSVPAMPTQLPTATLTLEPVATLGSQTVVGNMSEAFLAKYGSPASQNNGANGGTVYKYQNINNDIGELDLYQIPDGRYIYGVIIGPNTGNWDAITAIDTCIKFVPGDSKLDQASQVTNSAGVQVGLYQTGYSAELAHALTADAFIDQDSNAQIKAGTFSIIFSYVAGSNGTLSDACSVMIGQQSHHSLG